MKRTLTIICGIAIAALLAPTAAQAEMVILIDFGPASQPSSSGGGITWNSFGKEGTAGSLSTANLLYSDGDSSEVDLSVTEGGGYGVTEGGGDWANPDWDSASTNGDYILGWGGSNILTFFDLDASKTYTIELISSANHPAYSYDTIFSIGTDIKTHNSHLDGDGPSGNGNHNLLTWSDISPVDNKIVLTGANSGYVFVNAIRFTEVPEPATMGLLGLGFAGMAVLRRRRRNK